MILANRINPINSILSKKRREGKEEAAKDIIYVRLLRTFHRWLKEDASTETCRGQNCCHIVINN